ncbi:hypothetical protein TNCT_341531, partial [Trichonephila clavata]
MTRRFFSNSHWNLLQIHLIHEGVLSSLHDNPKVFTNSSFSLKRNSLFSVGTSFNNSNLRIAVDFDYPSSMSLSFMGISTQKRP